MPSRKKRNRPRARAPLPDGAVVIHPAMAAVPREPAATDLLRDAGPSSETPAPAVPLLDPPAPASAPSKRALSLDAVRGLFLVLMTLGFTIQPGIFPDWMYHRQFPPPAGELADVAGISWRDLAYAAFLFTMAAAFPITLGARIRRGATEFGIAGAMLKRAALLFVFALLIGHANPFFIGYTQTGRAIAIVGFAVILLLFLRPPADWDPRIGRTLRTAGWFAAVAFLLLSPLLYDSTFTPTRRDEVIANLAFAGLAGSLLWYATRDRLDLRLGALALVLALHLSASGEGWVSAFWWRSPLPWLFVPSWLSLLAVVIPGTIAGDLLQRWMRAPEPDEPYLRKWSRPQMATIAALAAAFTPLLVVGLYDRWTAGTTLLAFGLLGASVPLLWHARTAGERVVQHLFAWGAFWLVLGLFLEPFEGGIKKVPGTLSYFFAVAGLTTMLLVTFSLLVDQLALHRRLRPFIAVGQNPMLCYIVFTIFLNSLLEALPPLRPLLRGSAGEALLRSALTVVVVIAIVQWSVRRRLFLRTG